MPACWLIPTMALSPARLAPGSCPCRTKTAVNRRSNVYPKKQSVVLVDWNNSDDALLGKTRKRLRISTHSNRSAPVRQTAKRSRWKLERRRNATGSLVQNLRAGFVPPEPPNRTSWYSATTTWVSGRFGAGKPSLLQPACRINLAATPPAGHFTGMRIKA